MATNLADDKRKEPTVYKVLVPVDFSPYSAQALNTAKSILGHIPHSIVVLHVIDSNFVERCLSNQIGTEGKLKKALFIQAKNRMQEFLRSENMPVEHLEEVICEGIPFLEINKKAVQIDADMIIMGNRGNSGDMQTIFFGSTTERVLRFMRRPVLCVPIGEDRKP